MNQPGPNPQLNLALSIVAPVIAVIAAVTFWFTKPVPVAPAAPTPVNVSAAKLPEPGVVFANNLPGGGTSAASGGGAALGGGPRAGGPPKGAGAGGGGSTGVAGLAGAAGGKG